MYHKIYIFKGKVEQSSHIKDILQNYNSNTAPFKKKNLTVPFGVFKVFFYQIGISWQAYKYGSHWALLIIKTYTNAKNAI